MTSSWKRLAAACVAMALTASDGRAALTAVSLGEAERRLAVDVRDTVLRDAGALRIVGAVIDGDDVILVGGPDPTHGAILDDVAVVLRALAGGSAPLVSLEKVDGRTVARWRGGVERTGVGERLLAADLVLKRSVLGLEPVDRFGFQSFFDLSLARADASFDVRDNFWFVAARTNVVVAREGVVAAPRVGMETRSRVTAVRDGSGTASDPAAETFSAGMTEHMAAVAAAHPALEGLRAVFEVVAVLSAVREAAPARALTYWTERYAPIEHRLADALPYLERRSDVVFASGQARTISVSGGIDTTALPRRLEDADVAALRTVVLLARPGGGALRWRLPIERWAVDVDGLPDVAIDRGAPLFAREGRTPGAVIERRVVPRGTESLLRLPPLVPADEPRTALPVPFTPARGGIAAQIDIRAEDFAR